MNFFEYLTRKEQERAFKAGQTNLNPELREKIKLTPKAKKIPKWLYFPHWNPNMPEVTPENAHRFFVKNKKPKNENVRIVITQNGDFYTNDLDTWHSIHKGIIAYMYIVDDPIKINKADFENWQHSVPDKFLCIMYYGPDEPVAFAESYGIDNMKKFFKDKQFIKKWDRILTQAGLPKIFKPVVE